MNLPTVLGIILVVLFMSKGKTRKLRKRKVVPARSSYKKRAKRPVSRSLHSKRAYKKGRKRVKSRRARTTSIRPSRAYNSKVFGASRQYTTSNRRFGSSKASYKKFGSKRGQGFGSFNPGSVSTHAWGSKSDLALGGRLANALHQVHLQRIRSMYSNAKSASKSKIDASVRNLLRSGGKATGNPNNSLAYMKSSSGAGGSSSSSSGMSRYLGPQMGSPFGSLQSVSPEVNQMAHDAAIAVFDAVQQQVSPQAALKFGQGLLEAAVDMSGMSRIGYNTRARGLAIEY